MIFQEACDILEISEPFTFKDLKKSYYKQSLKYHPDKNRENIKDCEKIFHKISDSYKYLNDYLNNNKNFKDEVEYDIKKSMDYEYLLKKFIESLDKFYDMNIDISKLIFNIINNYKDISNKMFENINNNTIIRIIGYIEKYYHLFNINKDAIPYIRNMIERNIECKDNIFILNPTIDNLFNNDIYKLNYMDEMYYIPLWHDELVYDLKDNSLIVKCIPKLPDHIFIDDLNNINVSIKLSFENIIDKEFIEINIGNKVFEIYTSELKVKKKQLITIKNKGFSRIDINNIYNIKNKSDIIIHIFLVN